MTKKRAKAAKETEPPVTAEQLFGLAICPACEGYGGVPHGDLWRTCQACGGCGRVHPPKEDEA